MKTKTINLSTYRGYYDIILNPQFIAKESDFKLTDDYVVFKNFKGHLIKRNIFEYNGEYFYFVNIDFKTGTKVTMKNITELKYYSVANKAEFEQNLYE